jgi:hypothetical protein
MHFNLAQIPATDAYKPLDSTVAPRPIALATTLGELDRAPISRRPPAAHRAITGQLRVPPPYESIASGMIQTDDTGQRSSLARMASADLVQTNGLGLALGSAR